MKNIIEKEISSKIKCINQIAAILSLLICILIVSLVGLIPEKLDVEYIKENYVENIDFFVAEKGETLSYLLCILAFPIFYMIFNNLCTWVLKNIGKEKQYRVLNIVLNYIGLIVIGIIILFSILENPIYYENGIIFLNWKICIPLIIMSIIAILFSEKIKDDKILKTVIYCLIGVILLIIGYLYVNGVVEHNEYEMHHFNAYYYPVLKINSGLTPGVDFNSIYGYYSYFFALITQGNVYSFLLFNCIIAILIVIAFSCMINFLSSVVKNKLIVLYAFLAIIYCAIIQQIMMTGTTYLQYVPHRILFPAIMLTYISFYLKRIDSKNKLLLQIIGFAISSIALFWNLDTGIVILGTWLIVLGYEILMTNSLKERLTYFKVVKLVAMAILSVIMYVLALNIVAYIRTDEIVGIRNIIFGQSNFIGSGYNMIRMKLLHPWLILAITYMLGLIIPLCALCNKKRLEIISKEKFIKCASILALSILGCGIFTYYQGRSHDSVFYSVMYPAIMLISIYLDYLIGTLKKSSKVLNPLKYIVIISIISVLSIIVITSVYSMLFNDKIKNMYYKNDSMENYYTEVDKVNEIIPNIHFLIDKEAYYYVRYEKKDTKKMSSHVDLFSYKDYEKIFDVINDVNNLCTSEEVYKVLITKYEAEFQKEIMEHYNVYLKGHFCIILDKEKMSNTSYDNELIKLGYEKVY